MLDQSRESGFRNGIVTPQKKPRHVLKTSIFYALSKKRAFLVRRARVTFENAM